MTIKKTRKFKLIIDKDEYISEGYADIILPDDFSLTHIHPVFYDKNNREFKTEYSFENVHIDNLRISCAEEFEDGAYIIIEDDRTYPSFKVRIAYDIIVQARDEYHAKEVIEDLDELGDNFKFLSKPKQIEE